MKPRPEHVSGFMRSCFFTLLFVLVTATCFNAQIFVEGFVRDAATGEPVPFCAVGLKGSSKGWVCNEDGNFRIPAPANNDTLVIVNIAYQTSEIAVTALMRNNIIKLKTRQNWLGEVQVVDNNFAYELFERCRKTLEKSKPWRSKAYFVLQSDVKKQPVELLECYYNASLNAAGITDLGFKNGRVGMAQYRQRYFVNKNTSKAITFLSLTSNDGSFPLVPFYFKGRQLRKNFTLKIEDIYDTIKPVYHIAFTPTGARQQGFSGEVWIDKKSSRLLKLIMQNDSAGKHPFVPLFSDGKINNVGLRIVKTFDEAGLPRHLDFDYNINYEAGDSSRTVNCKGLLYFYDYNAPFILPYFDYDPEFDDYRKIASLSYNENFWNNNDGLVYSDKMKKGIAYFRTNGVLLNYKNPGRPAKGLEHSQFFEYSYLLWSGKQRLTIKSGAIPHDTTKATTKNGAFLYQLYNVKAQIFLDINQYSDSLSHFSATVFDVYKSYYYLQEEPVTNCFYNIYFDLMEIERRKMEKEIRAMPQTLSNLEAAYNKTLVRIKLMEEDYFKTVDRGHNLRNLKQWNDKVISELGINNFAVFEIKP